MTEILLVLLLVLAGAQMWLFMRVRRLKRNVENLRVLVDNQENYTFLVDQSFEVKESNVHLAPDQPHILGNVLHCRNAHEAGHCGEAVACRHCPVRFVIRKSFERHDDFRGLEASMMIHGSDASVSDVDVCVDGNFTCVANEPHMVVNVRDVTTRGGGVRPKVLFLSQNAALYDKVREALGISFRVLSVDTEHQALHRLLHAADYRFCAVLTDAAFFSANNAVTMILNERQDELPVFVFANKAECEAIGTANCLDEDISAEELLKLVVSTVA